MSFGYPDIRTIRIPGLLSAMRRANSTIHGGHDHVGNQQIDRLCAPFRESERVMGIGCREHRVPLPLEDLHHEIPHHPLVFDDENRLRTCRQTRPTRPESPSGRSPV
jgi:hypothetical protein